MLSSEQNPEECDARDDDSSNTAGKIIIFYPPSGFSTADGIKKPLAFTKGF